MNGTDDGSYFPMIPFFHSDVVYGISDEKRSLVHSRHQNADKLQLIRITLWTNFQSSISTEIHIPLFLKY
jgi:hypothetical protein